MGPLRIALCTGALAVTVLTPAAYAVDGDPGISVTPATPAPGTDVTLEVERCAGRTAVAVSPAFVSEVRLTISDGVLVGENRVRSTLTAGTYQVLVDCAEQARQGTVTVVPAREQPAEPTGSAEPTAPASSVVTLDVGRDGTLPLVAHDVHEDGPGVPQTLTGLLLVTAAGAVVRGRIRRRGGTPDC